MPSRGFALVIALGLMGLIVLLVLSLVAFMRLETAAGPTNRDQLEARQNALLALDLALAQLQQLAGPDQRSTAQANIRFTAPIPGNPTNPSPAQRTSRRETTQNFWSDRNPYWTGVWDTTRPRADQRPAWLVSGNNGLTHHFDLSTPVPGLIEPEVNPGPTWITLADHDTDFYEENDRETYRFNPAVRVPGVTLPLADNRPAGSFAYWVGDEGVKASLAFRDPRRNTSPGSPDYTFRLQTPHRYTVGLVADFSDFSDPDAILDENPVPNSASLPLVFPRIDEAAPHPLHRGFHDFTHLASGVLADVRRGGLRLDLTPFLENGVTAPGLTDNSPIIRSSDFAAGDPIFQGANGFPNSNINLPNWGLVRSWYERSLPHGGSLAVSPKTESSPGAFPQISFYRLHGGLSYVNEAGGSRLRFIIIPQIALWNPYDVTLEGARLRLELDWEGILTRLEVASTIGTFDALGNPVAPADRVEGNFYWHPMPNIAGTTAQRTDPHRMAWRLPNGSNPGRWTFEIEMPNLAPGEVLAFFPNQGEAYTGTNVLVPVFDELNPEGFYVESPFLITPALPEPGPNHARMNADFRERGPWGGTFEEYKALRIYLAGSTSLLTDLLQIPNSRARTTTSLRLNMQAHETNSHIFNRTPADWRYLYHQVNWETAPLAQNHRPTTQIFGIPSYGNINIIGQSPDLQGQSRPVDWKVQKDLRLFANYNPIAADSSMNPVDLDREYQPLASAGLPDRLHYFFRTDATRQNTSTGSYPTAFDYGRGSLWAGTDGRPRAAMLERYVMTDAKPVDPFYPISHLRRTGTRLVSLGEFQHVPFARFYEQPFNAFGNAEASPYVRREGVTGFTSDRFTHNNLADNRQVDLSWLLNDAVWDRYFLSTLPSTGSLASFRSRDPAARLPNPALTFTGSPEVPDSSLRRPESAAQNLILNGAFNVNSTSVNAWKALLSSFRGLQDGFIDDPIPSNSHPIRSRANYATGPIRFTPNVTEADAETFGGRFGAWHKDYRRFWGGNRYLTDQQIEGLAERIVDEVRARGPFLSLSDFINRRLVAPASFDKTVSGYDPFVGLQGLNGTLQRALNLSGINGGDNSPVNRPADQVFNTGITDSNFNQRFTIFPNNNYHYLDAEHRSGTPAGTPNSGTVRGIHETGQKFAHSPGFLTQADLLTILGPLLNARSDTFIIRSYGDAGSLNADRPPVRIWLEATVQRLPEEDNFGGRKFAVVDVRWLDAP
jgi:hypothetical protein